MTFVGSGGDPTLEIKRRTWMKKKKRNHTHTQKKTTVASDSDYVPDKAIHPSYCHFTGASLSFSLSLFLSLSLYFLVGSFLFYFAPPSFFTLGPAGVDFCRFLFFSLAQKSRRSEVRNRPGRLCNTTSRSKTNRIDFDVVLLCD